MYLTIPLTVDDRALADDAVTALQTAWPDWQPNDGDLEVILLETLAVMASDAAAAASQVPDAVFEAICAELHGIIRAEGIPATSNATFVIETGSLPIPAATEIDVDGFAFTTDIDAVAAPIAEEVPITAVTATADANGLNGDRVSMVTALADVVMVNLDHPTSGGQDEETFPDFVDRAVFALQLQGTTLVTVRDYELIALAQPYIGRVLVVQDPINRLIQLYALQPDGTVLTTTPSGGQKQTLLNLLNTYRETNWIVSVNDPTISDIDVTYSLVLYPGSVAANVVADADSALTTYLNPATWGQPTSYGEVIEGTWLVETTVRKNKLIDLLGNVSGVNFVSNVVITGTNGVAQGNGDFIMNGTAPLARARSLYGQATVG